MVIALHVVEVKTSEMADIDGGMAPEEQASAVLVPLFYERSGSFHIGRHIPDIAFRHVLEVSQPEEHTVGIDYID